MNDLGVSLHAHNLGPTFRAAMEAAPMAEFNARYLQHHVRHPDRQSMPAQSESPIVGVQRTIPEWGPGARSAVEEATPFAGTITEYAARAVARLRTHLMEHWDASRPTLVAHSSGYDSRILSSCLAQLRDDGFDLGTVHFRCRPPEDEAFRVIMRRQGWKPEQWSVFDMSGADPLDVGCWDRPGVSPWLPVTNQINFWRDIVPYAEEHGWNLCGGSGGGEAVEYPSLRKPPTVPWSYCVNAPVQRWFSYFPDGTDFAADVEARFAKVLFPYFGLRHIQTIAELPDRFLGFDPSGADNVRAAMLRQFGDSTLDIPLDIPRTPRTYAWSISAERWAEMGARYEASSFRRAVSIAPPTVELMGRMRENFFSADASAERLWRFAALWEQVRPS